MDAVRLRYRGDSEAQISGWLTDRFGGVPVLTVRYIVTVVTLTALTDYAPSTIVAPIIGGVLALAWGRVVGARLLPQQWRPA